MLGGSSNVYLVPACYASVQLLRNLSGAGDPRDPLASIWDLVLLQVTSDDQSIDTGVSNYSWRCNLL